MDFVERYQVIKIVGRGAMGEVWLAEDRKLRRNVALKFLSLSPSLSRSEKAEAVERFYREAQAAARLTQFNIVTIHDVDEIDGRHFISMEYLDGQTLDEVIGKGPQAVEQAVDVIAQVADALAYAHSQGVVHRDVKPENIFVLSDGTVKVTDFGIARVMGSSTMTQVGTIMGTPGYMSPEQVRGEQADWRTDIFSTGVVLYELLTGVKAFDADSLHSVLYKVVNQPPPPLASLRPDLPGWIVEVVERACAKDQVLRYQDASRLARDLRSHSLSAGQTAAAEAGRVFCTACGKELRENSKFCTGCGKPAKGQEPAKDDKPAKALCVGCGKPLRGGGSFCTACGRKS